MGAGQHGLAGLRIGLLTASASRAGGGVFEAVVHQAALIHAAGGEPTVFALADAHSDADRARFGATPVRYLSVRGPRQVGWAPAMVRALVEAELDVLHLHGIWMYPSRAGAAWAKATGRPYLISPHGMLDPWITRRGRWKKALARAGYERASWRRAAALHALTAAEAEDIARETGRGDALVIPNAAPPLGPAREGTGRDIVYLGRIHPKKNLARLIDAWSSAATSGATLTIAGWGAANEVRELQRDLETSGRDTRFVGAVHGAEKERLLREARALVLPSFSEGLPMVVLEAWAAGTPVVMTDACHLPQGFAAGAATRCGTDPMSIAAGLSEVLALDPAAWRRRSVAAQALAGGTFSAERIAGAWTEAYRRLAA